MELSALRRHRTAILDQAVQHGASNVRVFGSVARASSGAESDVDLLVDIDEGRSLLDLIGLHQDLEKLLQCRVDVLTEAELSPFFRAQVLREAIAL